MDQLRRYARSLIDEPMARVVLRGTVQHPFRRRRFQSFGEKSLIHRPDWIYGPQRIAVGDRVVILHGVWLSAERSTWDQPKPAIEIHDGVLFRPYVVVSASSSIVFEENVAVGASASFIDSHHLIEDFDHSPAWSPTEAEPIRVGWGTWIAEKATVLKGSTIGRKCIIGAHAVVKGDIPDYSIAVGAPARVVGSTRPTKAKSP